MDTQAYRAMQRMQVEHWWWRGMRALYTAALSRYIAPSESRRVIDIGCGFGANLPVLNQFGAVVGVDVEFDALDSIQQRPALGLVQARADALPFRAGTFDIIGLLAVVEHVEDDVEVLRETRRVGRPGTLQLLLTSAFMLLWSHHDVANNHCRRYRAAQLNERLRAARWQVLQTSYVNAAIFPAALAIRLLQRRSAPAETARYDMGPDLGPLNRVLEAALRLEGWLITRLRLPLPFGVDLVSIGRHDG